METVELLGTQGLVGPEQERFQALSGAIEFLEAAEENPELFEEGPWGFWFSTGSVRKQIEALAVESLRQGLVPILPIGRNLFHSLELDATTGKLPQNQALPALAGGFGGGLEASTDFRQAPVEQKARALAFLKAYTDPNPSHGQMVVATDVAGKTGEVYLQKMNDEDKQRLALKAMRETREIRGAVGCAVGAGEGVMVPIIMRPPSNFEAGVVRFRVKLRDIRPEDIDKYVKRGQEEMGRSGLVIDLWGSVCQEMGLVEGVWVEGENGFKRVSLEEARPIILGYPTGKIRELVKRRGEDLSSEGSDQIVGRALIRMKTLKESISQGSA